MYFIEKFKNLMMRVTDAPDDFIEASAMFLISTFAGRKYQFMSVPEMNLFSEEMGGGKLLNLWFMFLGKSRISRKSTVVSKTEEAIREVDNFIMLPQDFTPQSLVQVINARQVGNETRVTWINDEISGFFEQLQKAEFMVSTDALLSRIYDGRNYYRHTISRQREEINNPYISILLASTEYLPSLFTEGALRQGFLNRFIFVTAEKERHVPLMGSIPTELDQEAQEILEWLKALNDIRMPTMMTFDTPARELYNQYEEEIEHSIKHGTFGIEECYYGNLPNLLIRLACIFRLARMSASRIASYTLPIMVVEEQDVNEALSYVKKVWRWFLQTLTLMRTYAPSRKIATDENKITFIYNIIASARGKSKNPWVSRRTLLKKTRLLKKEVVPVIDTLVEMGVIEEKEFKRNSWCYRVTRK